MAASNAFSMEPTRHALERWQERFPCWNMYAEYQSSKPIGRGKLFKRIKAGLSRGSLRKMCRYGGSCYMLWAPRSNAVFVMDKGAVVITVLKMPQPEMSTDDSREGKS